MARTVLRKIFSSLRKRIQRKRVVHFLHIGKTGGTAINHALESYRETARYIVKRHGHAITLRDISRGEGVIFFLRDPLTRFVSGFNSRLRRGEPRAHNPWTAAEKDAFSRFDTPNRLATALSSDDEEVRHKARKAMKGIEHVRDSFWKWFESEEYFFSRIDDIVFIGFQENLLQDFETVKLKLGLPKSVSLPTDEVLAHKNPRHMDKALDDRAVENLKHWYAEDIKFYAQCKNYPKWISQRDRHAAIVREGGKRDSVVVDFLIAGAQKGGTSALTAYLGSHPEICLAKIKETHFFDSEANFKGRRLNYALLHKHFTPGGGQLLGEATPVTMYWEAAPRRVWEYNPRMKLICLLRDPIDRALSHWNMERELGFEKLSFADALNREAERCRAALPLQHRIYSYTDRGFYCEQIRRLWRFFPREQTLFLKTEDLRTRPQETLDRVFDFLGVRRQSVEPQVVHARPYTSEMGLAERSRLADLYECEVRQLERLLDWDCRDWLRVSR